MSKMNRHPGVLLSIIIILVVTSALMSACTEQLEIPSAIAAERTELNTAYGTDAKQKLDIYLPKGRDENTPVVFIIHGGAWKAGDKNEMNGLIPLIRGAWPECAVVNVNYRFANGTSVTATEIMADINAAVNFIVENKEEYKISSNMAMLGASAGSQLALLYAYQFNSDNHVKCVSDLFGPAVIDDWSWYSSGYNIFLQSTVKDVLSNFIGTTWTTETKAAYEANSPHFVVNATNAKPTIIFHGTLDPIVPIYQSEWLHNKLNTLSVTNEYHTYVAAHGFSDNDYRDCMTKTVTFFKANMQ